MLSPPQSQPIPILEPIANALRNTDAVRTMVNDDEFLNYISHITTTAIPQSDNTRHLVNMEGTTCYSVASIATSGIRIKGTITGQPVDFLIDCGADISVLSSSLVKDLNLNIKPTTVTMKSADGKPIQCAGYVTFTLDRANEQAFEVTALVAPHLHDSGLLGCDFLRKYKALIDFADQSMQLQLRNSPIPLSPRLQATQVSVIRQLILRFEEEQTSTVTTEEIKRQISTWTHLHPHKRRLIEFMWV